MISARAAALMIAAFGALALGPAPSADAAPSGPGSAQRVVDSLQNNGYRVILNRTGTAPLDKCEVTAVRPGRDITELENAGDDSQFVRTYTTVYVDARC